MQVLPYRSLHSTFHTNSIPCLSSVHVEEAAFSRMSIGNSRYECMYGVEGAERDRPAVDHGLCYNGRSCVGNKDKDKLGGLTCLLAINKSDNHLIQ